VINNKFVYCTGKLSFDGMTTENKDTIVDDDEEDEESGKLTEKNDTIVDDDEEDEESG